MSPAFRLAPSTRASVRSGNASISSLKPLASVTKRPERLLAIEKVLEAEVFANLERVTAPRGAREAILRVHPAEYLDAIEMAAPREGYARLDGDTVMNASTLEAGLHALGGACLAVDEIMSGRADNAFVAMRPPGHHAERATAMGFCFFNNAAIAARHAQAVHGAERVAIMDFDVHHGNGSQDIFWADPTVMYASTHQMPLYPGTGARNERGDFDTIVNAPLRAGDGGDVFREAMETTILPRIKAFRPDLILISAGFDAHHRDPLANLRFVEDDFGWATVKLMEIADRHANGRVVSCLEGGYDLEGLAKSAGVHVRRLMGA